MRPTRKFDLTGDQSTDLNDLLYLVRDILGTSIGDADLDGRFSSDDFIRVFQAGEFGDPPLGNSTWADGDWNCDGDFNEDDLMFALQWGDYELEAAAVPAVPRAAVAAALAHEIRPTAAGRDTDRDVQMPAPTSPTRTAVDLELASRESFFADYEPDGKLASSTAEDAVDLLLDARVTGKANAVKRFFMAQIMVGTSHERASEWVVQLLSPDAIQLKRIDCVST